MADKLRIDFWTSDGKFLGKVDADLLFNWRDEFADDELFEVDDFDELVISKRWFLKH